MIFSKAIENSNGSRLCRLGCLSFSNCLVWIALLGLGTTFGIQVGLSQEFGSRSSPSDKASGVLRPGVRPDVVVMRNEAGENVFVPSSRYEEFERFLEEKSSQVAGAETKETLDRMEILIFVEKSLARLKIDADVKLREQNNRWKSIPIGLGLTQIVPTVLQADSGVSFPHIRMSNENSGYEWLLAPGTDLNRHLTFDSLCNVSTAGQTQTLRIDLPAAPTTVKLNLPSALWDLTVTGSGSEVVEPFREVNSMSQALIRASGGSIVLSWTKKTELERIQAIEVESQTKYIPTSDSKVFRSVTNLSIRGPKALGGRRFLIALPKNSQWRDQASPIPIQGYRIAKSESAASDQGTVLMLDFDESVSRTETELIVEWQQSIVVENQKVLFAIPKIEGVQRHVGTMELVVPKSVRFIWDPQIGIEFVKQAGESGDAISYLFRFLQHDNPLIATWMAGDSLSTFKARYQLVQDLQGFRLIGSIDMAEDVRSFPFLQFETKGWLVERLQVQPSGTTVDSIANRTGISKEGPPGTESVSSISLSLSELLDSSSSQTGSNSTTGSDATKLMPPNDEASALQRTSSGRESSDLAGKARGIHFVLSKPFQLELSQPTQLNFSFPMLSWLNAETQERRSVCVPGEFTIQELIADISFDMSRSVGLKSLPSETGVSDRPSEFPKATTLSGVTSTYFVKGKEGWNEVFGVAEAAKSMISATGNTDLFLSPLSLDVNQTWSLKNQGPVPESLLLRIPNSWLDQSTSVNDSFQVIIGTATESLVAELEETQPVASNNDVSATEMRSVRIKFPDPIRTSSELVQQITLRVIKKLKLANAPEASVKSFTFHLPILQSDNPHVSLQIEQSLGELKYPNNLIVRLRSPLNSAAKTAELVDSTVVLPFDFTRQDSVIEGEMIDDSTELDQSIRVESAWLQSISNAVERRERLVVRFQTHAPSISLRLSEERLANCKVLVNGSRARVVEDPAIPDRIEVLLSTAPSPAMATNSSFVVEIFTWPTSKPEWVARLQPELPIIENTKHDFPLMWQIVVPSSTNLVGTSNGLSAGYSWSWKDVWSSRMSDLSQADIERQLGSTIQPAISQNTNQYLFYALNQRASMQVWMAPRYLLWAPVALCLLLGTIAVMEFRWLQKPWLAVLVLIASLGFSMWAWDFALAILQCMALAIGIAFLYSSITWLVDRRNRRRTVFSSRPMSTVGPTLSAAPPHSGSSRIARAPIAILPTQPILPTVIANLEGNSTPSGTALTETSPPSMVNPNLGKPNEAM